MELLLRYLFYGVYTTAFAFFLLVLYLNRTNRRIGFLLKKINLLSGDDENEGFPDDNIKKTKRLFIQLTEKIRVMLNNINIRRYVYEYLFGANIITIIGGILFVLGMAFFVRYPIFDQYLSITARMVTAVTGSILLIIISHFMYKNHPAFSSVIMGASFSIMYFSFITAYYNHHIFDIKTTFIIIFIITVFAVTLSFIYKRYLLVTLAFLAAYTTPFLVSYNVADSFLLFKYIIILNVGLLIQISFKKSLFLNITGFAFTGIYFLIWLVVSLRTRQYQDFDIGFLYLIIFYIILIPINSLSNIFQRKLFKAFELSVIITLNMLFYAAGMNMLSILNPDYRGLFTAFPAIVNLILLLLLLKYVKYNQHLIYLAIGLIVVFTSLIPPVELVGRSISMVWALQLILLLWISQKINVVLMKLGAFLISIAFTINTLIELWDIYITVTPLSMPKPFIINSDFLSGIATAFSLIISIFLMKKEKGKYLFKPLTIKYYKIYAGATATILLYFTMYVELKYHLTTLVTSLYSRIILESIFHFGFVLIPIVTSVFIKQVKIKKISIILSMITLTAYIFTYYFVAVRARSAFAAGNNISPSQFYTIFTIDIIMIIILIITHFNSKVVFKNHKYLAKYTLSPLIVFVFVSFSFTLDHLWVINHTAQGIMTSELLEKVHLLPYTLLWSGLALSLTVIGTIFKIRQFRQLAILAVIVILGKLFLHDLIAMNTHERTFAMMTVGSILIIITFVHQFNQKKVNPLDINELP